MNACPKCGSKQGYTARLVMSYQMTGAWGEDWETSGTEHAVHKPKTVKCVDCGKRVDREAASNAIDSGKATP